MSGKCVALFGEAEKGSYHEVYFCKTLPELAHKLGNPPEDSQGLQFAVQSLLYGHELLFFRVKEEGFSVDDYIRGIRFLESMEKNRQLMALCLPGVGDEEIFKACTSACRKHQTLLVTSESDFYDYMTEQRNFA